MRFKDDKRRVELTDLQVRQLIEYLMEARNRFLDKGFPTDGVSNHLCAVMNSRRNARFLSSDMDNSFAVIHPELNSEWSEKNGMLIPNMCNNVP